MCSPLDSALRYVSSVFPSPWQECRHNGGNYQQPSYATKWKSWWRWLNHKGRRTLGHTSEGLYLLWTVNVRKLYLVWVTVFCGGFFVWFVFFCFDYKPTCILCNVFLEPYCEFIFFGSSVIYQKLWVLRDWEYRSRDWKHHCRHWTLGLTVFYYGINKHENQHEAYEYQLQWRGIVIYGLNRKFCP